MKKVMGKDGEYIFLHTVKDLKEFLKDIPDDVTLSSCDADIGGYDVCTHTFVNPHFHDTNLSFGHDEYRAYEQEGDAFYVEHFEERDDVF